MTSVLSILNEIAANPSTNAKEAILKREKDNTVLRETFAAAYDPTISYYIRKIPEYKHEGGVPLIQSIKDLKKFSKREVTGQVAIGYLTLLLGVCDEPEVIERIIDRDLRCGCSDSIASRVWPGLVPTFDVMLSHKDISGIKFPAYAQIKSDGARCHMMLRDNGAMAFSRNGKPIELHGTFDALLSKIINDGETLDGELLAVGKDGKILDRKTGNGMINTLVKYNDVINKLQEEICRLEKKLEALK